MELKKYKLNVIAEILAGGTPSTKKPEYWNGNIPWLSVKDFGNVNKIVSDTEKTITQLGFNNSPSSLLHRGDLIISTRGTVGKIAMVDKDMAFNQSCFGLRANKELVTSDFLFYWFANNQQIFKSAQQGNIFKSITLDFFDKTLASIPPLDQQRRIASVLSSLDSKIALNRRINTKLETIAKRLYDYWFVQFDFPDANGNPYKSSGGKMVWNDALKREIPEGWEVKSVAEITTAARGVSYTAKDEKTADEDNVVLILRGNNIVDNHIVYDSNAVYVDSSFVMDEQIIKKYDVVITMSSGSKEHVGKSAMFFSDSPHSYGAFCNKLTPKRNCQFFLENYLHSDFFIKYIRQSCSGTGINNLTNAHFKKSIFAFPPTAILSNFNQKVNSIYEKRGIVEQEITRLTALRDKLLPLLMNGQVEVA
jgi:type I restriction enzyme S subunit